jgi:endoribonuclease Dicer
VNRKGVALPTSSEETKRAKRENLEQKQILVPELCLVHVVPASLWRQAVCLPCILYRINALLLADEIRTTVAREISLGIQHLKQGKIIKEGEKQLKFVLWLHILIRKMYD